MTLIAEFFDYKLFPDRKLINNKLNNFTKKRVRVVLFDTNNNVAVMHLTKVRRWGLLGGEIEKNEGRVPALRREVLEEAGYEICKIRYLGKIITHQSHINRKELTFCYVAQIKGEQMKNNLTESEKRAGYKVIWFDFEKAIAKFEVCVLTKQYLARFMANTALTLLNFTKNERN